MMDTETAIRATLRSWAARDFAWGQADCMLSVADYLALVLGQDCAAHWRGAYASRRACAEATGYDRDPVAVAASCVARLGLGETGDPRRGDVGVIRAPALGGLAVVGALCLGGRWAAQGRRGLVFADRPDLLAAWRVPA